MAKINKTKKELNTFKSLKRKKSVSCRFCSKIFVNRFDLIVHNASHITISVLKLENFPSQSAKTSVVKVKIHKKKYDLNRNKIHGAVNKECNTNSMEHTSEGDYDNLMQPAIYKCKYCKRFFTTRFSLIQHQAVHLYVSCALKPQICRRCDRYIPGYPYNLQKHVRKVHRRSIKIKRQLTL